MRDSCKYGHINPVRYKNGSCRQRLEKYVRRYQAKNGEDDLSKGRWYAARLHGMIHDSTLSHDLHTEAVKTARALFAKLTSDERDILWPEWRK